MANSSSNIDQLSQSQSSKEITINALLDAASPATLYGRRESTTSGLSWGYYGGTIMLGSTTTQIANGTLTLPANATSYIQANPSSGAVTSNTVGFTAGYWQMYIVVAGISTISSYTDNRVLGQSLTGVGFANPMSASGDIIYGGAAGAATRLAKDTDGTVLMLAGGLPVWSAAPWMTNPMTAAGDLISGGASGVAERLPAGTTGQVLTIVGGVPAWAVAPGGGSGATIGAVNVFTRNQSVDPSLLTSGSSIAVDASLSNNFKLVLGANATLANPTNLTDGMVLNVRIKQDATGNRTLAYGSAFKFPGGTPPILSTAANAVDLMSCYYDSTDGTLACNLSKGYA
ncbi:hypothetical protein [Glaciimonas sp. PCH181]|uniref:hypothetical protein n=1 Tax=Glaciimonas sp. PCH181 TaxID=2133943 RepID=UPI000D3C37E6|nr:hypothetical protein [Glaciimonas sp. PCH181]PUA17254.1 hypothetical protein C7W93_15085 [Glaciimonas sp. PCH181]